MKKYKVSAYIWGVEGATQTKDWEHTVSEKRVLDTIKLVYPHMPDDMAIDYFKQVFWGYEVED